MLVHAQPCLLEELQRTSALVDVPCSLSSHYYCVLVFLQLGTCARPQRRQWPYKQKEKEQAQEQVGLQGWPRSCCSCCSCCQVSRHMHTRTASSIYREGALHRRLL